MTTQHHTTEHEHDTPDAARAASTAHGPTVFAGWWLVGISVLHTAVFAWHPYWTDWLTGGLWGLGASGESATIFWALPGSFVVVLAVLGLLVTRMGRRGEHVPDYVPWAVGAWCVACVAIVGPSGFMTGIVPCVVLLVSSLRRRIRARAT